MELAWGWAIANCCRFQATLFYFTVNGASRLGISEVVKLSRAKYSPRGAGASFSFAMSGCVRTTESPAAISNAVPAAVQR